MPQAARAPPRRYLRNTFRRLAVKRTLLLISTEYRLDLARPGLMSRRRMLLGNREAGAGRPALTSRALGEGLGGANPE